MLNYETILSSYDDKMTLMQWLKKVEEALNHASATAFRVNKKGNATISFILDFEDGTKLESGDIVLQQGESVNGAYIENNHLFITLTNGQVIDTGLLFNGNLTINGTLDATKVTGDEIVEKMTGYTFIKNTNTGTAVITPVYISAVKNGNKLTLVYFGNITRNTETALSLGRFTIPASISSKLFPYQVGSNEVLSQKNIACFDNVNVSNAPVDITLEATKASFAVILNLRRLSQLTADVSYNFRAELTFLLSDNMAGN